MCRKAASCLQQGCSQLYKNNTDDAHVRVSAISMKIVNGCDALNEDRRVEWQTALKSITMRPSLYHGGCWCWTTVFMSYRSAIGLFLLFSRELSNKWVGSRRSSWPVVYCTEESFSSLPGRLENKGGISLAPTFCHPLLDVYAHRSRQTRACGPAGGLKEFLTRFPFRLCCSCRTDRKTQDWSQDFTAGFSGSVSSL